MQCFCGQSTLDDHDSHERFGASSCYTVISRRTDYSNRHANVCFGLNRISCFSTLAGSNKRRWGRRRKDVSKEDLIALGLKYGESDRPGRGPGSSGSGGSRASPSSRISVDSLKRQYNEGWVDKEVRLAHWNRGERFARSGGLPVPKGLVLVLSYPHHFGYTQCIDYCCCLFDSPQLH